MVIDMNKLGPNVTHKSRWKLIVKGICLIEYAYLNPCLTEMVELIFGKKTTKVGLHNMWCQGAENKRDHPGLFNVALLSYTVIMLAYH